MTHDNLIGLARRWLWSQGCVVVITEMTCGAGEQADAIGWFPSYSIVIECKANRADYLGDKKKPHNRSIRGSMGDKRYYLAPPGVIKCEELPEGYGLLEPRGRGVVKRSDYTGTRKAKNHQAEITLLLSAIRRMDGVDPAGAKVRCYQDGWGEKARATLGIKKEKPEAQPCQ